MMRTKILSCVAGLTITIVGLFLPAPSQANSLRDILPHLHQVYKDDFITLLSDVQIENAPLVAPLFHNAKKLMGIRAYLYGKNRENHENAVLSLAII
jgi:hypothetical protein